MALRSGDPEILNGLLDEAGKGHDGGSLESESFWQTCSSRTTWLVGLLFFQSMSSFILAGNDVLIRNHPTIVYFLTMLVGAGGNAGNQSAVRIIRGIATGHVNKRNEIRWLRREASKKQLERVTIWCIIQKPRRRRSTEKMKVDQASKVPIPSFFFSLFVSF
mmetsp:Transcript_20819/g.46946  ORF Transcript_20819/g.46946 Transcript_20819/m.46946 type:complete len:162 (-) Transcript_20819:134-619(-)